MKLDTGPFRKPAYSAASVAVEELAKLEADKKELQKKLEVGPPLGLIAGDVRGVLP